MSDEKNKKDDQQKNIINSFTNTLIEITKMNTQKKVNETLVNAIYFFHNIKTLQPDILRTNKKFSQLSISFLEITLNFFSKFTISQQFIRSIVRNFTWYAQSTGTLPQSDLYIDLMIQITLNFPNLKDDEEISEFFVAAFKIPAFVSSFLFNKAIPGFIALFFLSPRNVDSVPFLTQIIREKAIFPSTADRSSYLIISEFAKFFKNEISDRIASNSIHFISAYIEKCSRAYPCLVSVLFESNDFYIFYQYLIRHLGDSFIQFMSSLLSVPSEMDQVPNTLVLHFILTELFNTTISPNVHLLILQSLYYFMNEYNIDLDSIEPSNFFATLFNIPTHLNENIQLFLLDIFDLLVERNYEYSFSIFTNYLIEFKQESPFERLSHILSKLISGTSTFDDNSLQNLPIFFLSFETRKEFGTFLSEYPSFQMLLVVIFQHNYVYATNEQNSRIIWLNKVIESAEYFDHSNILIQMLTVEPSGELINAYIKILLDHFRPSLFYVLTTTLQQSYFLVGQFLQVRGLQTIDNLLPVIDDELVAKLLTSLSSHPFSDELNESILNLPENHRFFNLKTRYYTKILKNCPIRLPVLIPFAKLPPITFSHFDLINISKYAYPIFRRMNAKIPFLFETANRYITISQARSLIHDASVNFAEIIDLKSDHFSFYEFLPHSQNASLIFDNEKIEKKSLVFWVKIISPFYSKFTIFQTQSHSFIVENDVLKVSSSCCVDFERNIWHFILINNKFIKIDQFTYNFSDPVILKKVIFGQNNVNSLWRLSPNIRFIDSKDFDDFYLKGPNYFEQVESIVTLPEDALLVHYAGLPYFFQLPSFFSEFIKVIENCEDSERFSELFCLLCNTSVVNKNQNKIWPFILDILARKTDRITNYLIFFMISFIQSNFSGKHILIPFIMNLDFWKNISNSLLGYTLNHLLLLVDNYESLIFNFFINLLIITKDDQTKQIITFFLSKLSVLFPDHNYLKRLIELILFTKKYSFSQSFRLFFVQAALQINVKLTALSLPNNINNINNWALSFLSAENNDFYYVIFDLLCSFNINGIVYDFPENLDVTKFVSNFKFWHYFFSLLTRNTPKISKSLYEAYGVYTDYSNIHLSVVPSVVSLTLYGLSVFMQLEYQKKSDMSYIFLQVAIIDSFKILCNIYDSYPEVFANEKVRIFSQVICPLIPNLGGILAVNSVISPSEKFGINLNSLSQILGEILRSWEIDDGLQNLILSKAGISNFSLQSHSISLPKKKCEHFAKKINDLANEFHIELDANQEFNKTLFLEVLEQTGFVSFSVRLLIANEKFFNKLVYSLFEFAPFVKKEIVDEYARLPLSILLSMLNAKNMDAVLFEKIIQFIVEGQRNGTLSKLLDSCFKLVFQFINDSLSFIQIKQNNNLIALLRELIIITTNVSVQVIPNDVISLLLSLSNVINNELIFESPQMVCLMLSSLHVFLFQKNDLFSKLLSIIWPKNLSFQKFFIANYSNEVFDAFQSAAGNDNSALVSYLKNSPKSLANFVASSKFDLENAIYIQKFTNIDLEKIFSKNIYDLELGEIDHQANSSYMRTVVEHASSVCFSLYSNFSAALMEKQSTKLVKFQFKKEIISNKNSNGNQTKAFPFCWPFWMSRIISAYYKIDISQIVDQTKLLLSEPSIDLVVFNKVYQLNKETKSKFNAKLIRLDLNISVSVFVLEKEILILANSMLDNDQLILTKQEKYDTLIEMTTNEEFGKRYSFFNSHPLIRIPVNEILCVTQQFNDYLQIYCLNFATFILQASKKSIQEFLSIVIPFSKTNHSYFYDKLVYHRKLSIKKLCDLYKSRQLNNFEFILLLNALNGRSFINYQKTPFFPQSTSKNYKIKQQLVANQSACQYYAPDYFDTANIPNFDSIGFVFHNFTSLDSWELFSNFVSDVFNEQMKGLLTHPDPASSIIKIDNTKIKRNLKNILSKSPHLFQFTELSYKNINMSKNYTFLVIDNNYNNFSEVFRIFYQNKQPVYSEHVSFYFCPFRAHKTIINEHDLIAVSFASKTAIFWEIIRGATLCSVFIENGIVDAIFEENFGLVAFCSKNSFFIYTINGTLIGSYECQHEIVEINSFEELKIDYKTSSNETKTLFFEPGSTSFIPLYVINK